MKTCEHYEELVSAYADGETADAEIAELFYHLGTCSACRKYFHRVGQLQAFMTSNEPLAKPAAVPSAWKPPVWKRTFAVSYAAAAAVIVLMLATAALVLVRPAPAPTTVTTEYVYMTEPVNVVAQPLSDHKTN